jgi:hypothetical protein
VVAESRWGIIVHPSPPQHTLAPPYWALELAEPVGHPDSTRTLPGPGCPGPPARPGERTPTIVRGDPQCGPGDPAWDFSARKKVDILCSPLLELGGRKGLETQGDA